MLWSCSLILLSLHPLHAERLLTLHGVFKYLSAYKENYNDYVQYRGSSVMDKELQFFMSSDLYESWDSLMSIQCCTWSRCIRFELLPAEENVSFKVEWKILMLTFFKFLQHSGQAVLMWSAWTWFCVFVESYFCSWTGLVEVAVRRLRGCLWMLSLWKNSWMLWHVGVSLFFHLVCCWFVWL